MKKLRKIIITTLIVIICIPFVACNKTGNNVDDNSETTIVPIKSFEDQSNQIREWQGFTIDKDWVYTVIAIDHNNEGIIRFRIDDPDNKEIIYKYETDRLSQLSVYNDWVYFRLGIGDHGYEKTNLYKIKIDGSNKTKLASNMWSYILTENEIFYDSYTTESTNIYRTNHAGENKQKIGESELVGINNGWIYYGERASGSFDINAPYYLHKMRSNGKDKQKVLDDIMTECIVDNDTIYYTRYDTNTMLTTDLVQKTVNGKEIVLDSNKSYRNLYKSGDWLYYEDYEGCRIYKININNITESESVYYYGNDTNQGIFLYENKVFILLSENLVIIEKDGSTKEIKLWDY